MWCVLDGLCGGKAMVIYFSKINLESDHVYEVYHNSTLLRRYLNFLLTDLKDGIVHVKTDSHTENEEVFTTSTEYELKVRRKEESYIDGVIYKESKIYYKQRNKEDELIRKSVPNIEAIRFYLDVYKETVGFHTTNRFGYQEFNDAFSGIINSAMKLNNREFRYSVSLRTEGLEMKEIQASLRNINQIKELKIKMQPPNPDNEIINAIQNTGETVIDSMESGNITGMSFLFTSKGGNGLNLDSEIIHENLEKVEALSEVIGDKKAISKGYISVEAIGKNGKKYTTADQKPLKTVVDKAEEFFEACKSIIDGIF